MKKTSKVIDPYCKSRKFKLDTPIIVSRGNDTIIGVLTFHGIIYWKSFLFYFYKGADP